jgi:hypothetical protein
MRRRTLVTSSASAAPLSVSKCPVTDIARRLSANTRPVLS